MAMTGTMLVAGRCASGITAAGLTMGSSCSLVEKKSTKLHLHCSGIWAGANFKPATNAIVTPKMAFSSPSLRRSPDFGRLCARAAERDCEVAPSKVVVIDNYDSFTYNLCQYLGDLGCDYEVVRNDEITIEELKERKPRGILVSPGPGKIVRAPNGVVHGKTSPVYYDEKGEDGLLAGLPNLVIEKESFPEELEITAWTEDGLIMGVRHRKYKHIQGVQFHPESIITQDGKRIVPNFLKNLEQYHHTSCEEDGCQLPEKS